MATRLHRLGRWSFDHKGRVLGAWVLILALVIGLAATFKGQTSNAFSVPGTESQKAQDLLEQKFPGAGGASARVVFKAPEGTKLTDAANRAAIEESLTLASEADEVSTVVSPYEAGTITEDGTLGFADVIYPTPAGEIGDRARDELADVADPARAAGMQVEFGGGIVTEESETSSESIGLIVAFVVLAITLGSLLAAGLPLITAIVGVGLGLTGLTALSGVFEVSETAPILATMLGLAVGIDYALFILARHRQNLADGMTLGEAAAHATGTAGSAVVFAGATVVFALAGLVVVGIPFLTVMGLAAAGTVTIAVLIALTLLPALLGFVGMRITRVNRVLGMRPGRMAAAGRPTMSHRWVSFVVRRPVVVLLTGLALLTAVAIPATHMKLGLPDGGSESEQSTERRAYDLLAEGFGPGFNGQLTAVVDAPKVKASERDEFAQEVHDVLAGFPGVAAVSPPAQNEAGDLTIVNVTPTTAPADDATKDLVERLRARAAEIPRDAEVHAYVTGTTALNIDTSQRLGDTLLRYVAVVVGLALVLLTIVFRSLLVPIKAAVGFLVSIAAALGLVVFVFQDGHFMDMFGVAKAEPILSFLPVLLIGILFGLAMDYEVFLVSRMREHFVRTGKARESIVEGYSRSGRVVVAAATIMIAVFAAFILADDPITKSIGLSLAFGVFADAFLVRLTLVPAVMALMGDRAWWLPRGMQRVVPDLDIEGEKLGERLRPAPAAS